MKKKQRGMCVSPSPHPSIPHSLHLSICASPAVGGGGVSGQLYSCCRSFFSHFISCSLFDFYRVGVWGGGGTYPSSANMGSGLALALRSVRFAVVLGALQLHLQPLHADLEAVHGLDGRLCRHGIVVADKAWWRSEGCR